MAEAARWVAAARTGSEDAWRALVAKHQSRLVRLAWMLTGDRHLAEDVAQEAFVEAFLGLKRLRSDRAFSAWIRTILVRTARRRRTGKAMPAVEREHRRSADVVLAGRELYAAVDGAIASLPPIYRDAMALAMEGELDSKQAAAALGCSSGAYRVRLHKARGDLREMLRDHLME
ncbi:sigma-70 family RNA polymerase sigma factor [bacterium]|nr:sigma-70 family RNA polymerase sigma factor [bacterium]